METSSSFPSGLYPRLLGESWRSLDDDVRRFHTFDTSLDAIGVFRVRHGSNWLARMLARLAQLPSAGEAVDTRLLVAAQNDGEEWRRTFAGRPLVSLQAERSDGLLVERMGLTETWFRLAVVEGALTYEAAKVAMCLGPLRLPLPAWLSPRVTAFERPTGQLNQVDVFVEVQLAMIGRLISYEGKLTIVESQG